MAYTMDEIGKMLANGDSIDYNQIALNSKRRKPMADPPSKIRWDKEHTVAITIKFQRKTDQDCIDFLEGKNKRDTICAALREYMKNHKGD